MASGLDEAKSRRCWTRLEKALAIALVCAAAAAVAGFVLFAKYYVPADVAAKVNGIYISEHEVESDIAQYRAQYGAEEDSAFADLLLQQGMNVYTFRQTVVNRNALSKLICHRAEELGVYPTEGEIDEQVLAMRKESDADDDDSWAEMLAQSGASEESVRSDTATRICEQRIYEADVTRKEASDEQIESYIEQEKGDAVDKHSWRIVFTGDDAKKRAKSCLKRIKELGDNLSAEEFSSIAVELSDSPTVADDRGDAGWISVGEDTTYSKVLASLDEGELSGVEQTDLDGNYGIVYCDGVFEYPPSDAVQNTVSLLPKSLKEQLGDAVSEAQWEKDCNAYLASLLSDAQITYYPIPKGATYNIDMRLTEMASGEKLANG